MNSLIPLSMTCRLKVRRTRRRRRDHWPSPRTVVCTACAGLARTSEIWCPHCISATISRRPSKHRQFPTFAVQIQVKFPAQCYHFLAQLAVGPTVCLILNLDIFFCLQFFKLLNGTKSSCMFQKIFYSVRPKT